ncbi:MAG: hypothetical protein LBT86_04960 [Deltaproteobacteria bacterium]|jgi:hypothetical protein|nr:hypothetical protein [Deltaproteobacteria bacterium]
MIVLNRYALKNEYYLLKLVGLVLALNVVLILGWSREHLAQPIDNVTITNTYKDGEATEKDITDDISGLYFVEQTLQYKILTPNASGSSIPSDNQVVVNGYVAFERIFIAGGLSFSSNSENNKVILNNSANITGYVYGGYGNEKAYNNTVVINTTNRVNAYFDREVSNEDIFNGGQVVGGFSSSGLVEKNEVNFINGSANEIIGGLIVGGTARYNNVIINGTSVTNEIGITNIIGSNNGIYGSYIINDGNSTGNNVTFQNSNASSAVYGSYIGKNGNLIGNSVISFQNSNTSNYIYGSYISESGNSSGNSVIFQNSTVNFKAVSSFVTIGNSTDNKVTFFQNSNAIVVGGSFVINGNSTNNSVIFQDSTGWSVEYC